MLKVFAVPHFLDGEGTVGFYLHIFPSVLLEVARFAQRTVKARTRNFQGELLRQELLKSRTFEKRVEAVVYLHAIFKGNAFSFCTLDEETHYRPAVACARQVFEIEKLIA